MYIEKLDDLIETLQLRRKEMGNCDVAIDDNDTGRYLKIDSIKSSNYFPESLLIKIMVARYPER